MPFLRHNSLNAALTCRGLTAGTSFSHSFHFLYSGLEKENCLVKTFAILFP